MNKNGDLRNEMEDMIRKNLGEYYDDPITISSLILRIGLISFPKQQWNKSFDLPEVDIKMAQL